MDSPTHSAMQQLRSFFNLNLLPEPWRKHLQLLRNERFQSYFVIAFTFWLVGAVEIIQKAGGQRLDPRFWMSVAILITLYSGLRIFRLNSVGLGFNRSKTSPLVNEMMHRIQGYGLSVYYEPKQEKNGFGLVVVGQAGIYAMEVKDRPVFGSRTIEYAETNKLVIGGRISDARPLTQARTAAQQIQEKLRGIPQAQSAVRPLVVFLNEWQITQPNDEPEVAVINAAELESYLNEQQPVLTKSEIAQISARLE
ncbi:MAG TPA: nuclease-related domain-containing protein [Chthoniobacterales bacterium]|jgi:hypothetical protein